MGTESSSTTGAPKSISRRRVVAGAAWSVPAVMVASAAPAVAASKGPIEFTGRACKLPGQSSSIFKGYVFELEVDNVLGRDPYDSVTVITGVTVNGIADPGGYAVLVRSGAGTCSCGPCGTGPTNQQFCTTDGTLNQRVLLYTTQDVTGSSSNTVVTVTYVRYDCNQTDNCGSPSAPVTLRTEFNSTPPVTGGGGSCTIPDVYPLPDGSTPPGGGGN